MYTIVRWMASKATEVRVVIVKKRMDKLLHFAMLPTTARLTEQFNQISHAVQIMIQIFLHYRSHATYYIKLNTVHGLDKKKELDLIDTIYCCTTCGKGFSKMANEKTVGCPFRQDRAVRVSHLSSAASIRIRDISCRVSRLDEACSCNRSSRLWSTLARISAVAGRSLLTRTALMYRERGGDCLRRVRRAACEGGGGPQQYNKACNVVASTLNADEKKRGKERVRNSRAG